MNDLKKLNEQYAEKHPVKISYLIKYVADLDLHIIRY